MINVVFTKASVVNLGASKLFESKKEGDLDFIAGGPETEEKF